MKTFLFFLVAFGAITGPDASMLGITINAPADYSLALRVLNKQDNTTKYMTADGNHLSITTENGKVVFMENDWLHDKGGTTPLFTNFRFGETTLKEIRESLGTIGFTYSANAYLKSEINLTTINCFEFESPENVVLVAVTKAPIKSITNKDAVADFLKLDAVILADKKYLDNLWGRKKIFDPKYKKIKL
jgi:hypothetical protein